MTVIHCMKMADEEVQPINPNSSKEKRNRRRRSGSTPEEPKKAVSSSDILAASSSKDPISQENGHVVDKEIATKKKKVHRRNTPEPGIRTLNAVHVCQYGMLNFCAQDCAQLCTS